MHTCANLVRYYPESPKFGPNVVYLRDDSGVDWYEGQKFFQDSTYKIVVAKDGVVTSGARDASALFPLNCSVIELERKPEGFEPDGTWIYKDGVVCKKPVDPVAEATKRKAAEMALARSKMADLQILIDVGLADQNDLAAFNAWKLYFAKIFKIDPALAPNIMWPVRP